MVVVDGNPLLRQQDNSLATREKDRRGVGSRPQTLAQHNPRTAIYVRQFWLFVTYTAAFLDLLKAHGRKSLPLSDKKAMETQVSAVLFNEKQGCSQVQGDNGGAAMLRLRSIDRCRPWTPPEQQETALRLNGGNELHFKYQNYRSLLRVENSTSDKKIFDGRRTGNSLSIRRPLVAKMKVNYNPTVNESVRFSKVSLYTFVWITSKHPSNITVQRRLCIFSMQLFSW